MEEVRHKHYEYIIAWAKGAKIQRSVKQYDVVPTRKEPQFIWMDDKNPTWYENDEYRLKPVYKSQEVKITLLYHNWYIEPVDEGKGNCLITYNAVDEQIIDITIYIIWS